ncbi:hypothetical protein [Aquibacillus saliphilus]|uniref:hypothetical protein n=1 Tax=Aquibacillus saliphilus TaxID=1909422 RepID=UPI001CF08387|nr:hypothetical protein [Aquibacillus saliphilus]
MNVTTFDCNLWDLTLFEKVGYDKNNNVFVIYYFDGVQIEFSEIEELTVYQFIISTSKEEFIKTVLLPNYPYIQHVGHISKFN